MKMSIIPRYTLLVALTLVSIAGAQESVIYKCKTPGQLAITFDDAPSGWFTPQLLDLFKSYNLTTTLFVNGPAITEPNLALYLQVLRRAYDEGHQIASHSWSHIDLGGNVSPSQVREELRELSDLIYGIIGMNMTAFRPPYGSFNTQLVQIAQAEFGYDVVNWNIDTEDWAHPDDVDAGFAAYLDAIGNARDTSFIGLHHAWTGGVVALAERTIQYVLQNNFQIVTVAKCVGSDMYRVR